MVNVVKKTVDFLKKMLAMIVNPRLILDFFKIRNLDRNYNRMMANERTIRWVALIIAMVTVVSVRYTPLENTGMTEEIQLPLEIRINEEYTYFGSEIPPTVTVFLTGDPVQINLMRNSLEMFVDLRGLEPGDEHDVFIDSNNTSDRVTVRVEPQLIFGIQVAPIIERHFSVEENVTLSILPVLDIDPRYRMETTIEQEYVVIRGPEILLEQIAEIRAIIGRDEIDFDLETQVLMARLVASDGAGEAIGINISPIELEVLIEIREHTRELNLEVNLTNVPNNIRVQRTTVSPEAIEVWGLIDRLGDDWVLEVDFNDLSNQGRKTVTLDFPEGVYSDIEEVSVRVDFSTTEPSNGE